MIEKKSPSIEEVMEQAAEMEKDIADVFSLDQEDVSLLDRKVHVPGDSLALQDLERLKNKYQDRNRPDLVNVVIAWGDPNDPLYTERLTRTRRKIKALQAGDIETAKKEIEWFRSIFGRKE